jgi:flagellar biosynthesis chaperone FliJ
MRKTLSTHSSLGAFDAAAFGRPAIDAMRVPDPSPVVGSVCGITSRVLGRGLLMSADDGAGGGGDDKKFTQADVNRMITERLGKANAEKADLEKRFGATVSELEAIKAQVAELSGAAEKAKEEAELKGKTDVEKAQVMLTKAQDRIKALESERDTIKSTLSADLEKAKNATIDYAKRQAITSAVSSQVADGMTKHAVRAILEEAQIELNDKYEPIKVTYDGKEFDKLDAFAGEFFKANQGFAKRPDGGSGHPLNSNGSGKSAPLDGSSVSLLSQGLAARPAAS